MKKILHIILFCTLVLGGQVFAAEEPNTTKNVEVLVAVKQDLIDRYKIEIDLIVERLKEKINRLESTEQKVILDNLQERILTKQGELESDDTIDTLRKEIKNHLNKRLGDTWSSQEAPQTTSRTPKTPPRAPKRRRRDTKQRSQEHLES